MRRSDLLRLVGIPITTYNAISNRGLIPFGSKKASSGWSHFTEEHAIRLALLLDLTRAGMSQTQASKLVRTHFSMLERVAENLPDEDKPRLMFGGAAFVDRASEASPEPPVAPIAAPFGDLDRALREAAPPASKHAKASPAVIVLVDASACMEALLRRAAREQLPSAELREWARFLGASA